MPRVLGLCGYAGSGKDFIYGRLAELLGDQVVRVAFADSLRQELDEVLTPGSGVTTLPALWTKPYSPEVRWILQQYGTEFRRSQDPDYWVKRTIERILALPADKLAVVTDVRFENEAHAIRVIGGKVAEVRAPEEVRRIRLGGFLPDGHASEIIDFPIDGAIQNTSEPWVNAELLEYIGLPAVCGFCTRLSHVHPGTDKARRSRAAHSSS